MGMRSLVVLLALGLAFVSCGGDEGPENGNGGASGGAGGSGGTGGAGGSGGAGGTGGTGGEGGGGGAGGQELRRADLTIRNFAYVPPELVVAPGTRIVITNEDDVAHSVTSQAALGNFRFAEVNGISFNVPVEAFGTAELVIDSSAQVGTVVPYYCELHKEGMGEGTIRIEEP